MKTRLLECEVCISPINGGDTDCAITNEMIFYRYEQLMNIISSLQESNLQYLISKENKKDNSGIVLFNTQISADIKKKYQCANTFREKLDDLLNSLKDDCSVFKVFNDLAVEKHGGISAKKLFVHNQGADQSYFEVTNLICEHRRLNLAAMGILSSVEFSQVEKMLNQAEKSLKEMAPGMIIPMQKNSPH